LEDASPAVRKYRYNGLVRLALMIYDYDTIIKIKEMILSEEEMN
jgi:hypothetical protein